MTNTTEEKKRIVLFSKEKKKNSDPDYSGKIMLGEIELHQVALWKNKSKEGLDYLSGYINDPYKKDESGK
jgi:uncharacterized protein (DUF736 family)